MNLIGNFNLLKVLLYLFIEFFIIMFHQTPKKYSQK